MGQLVDGNWIGGDRAIPADGEFRRTATTFRNWITPDGSAGPSGAGGFVAESGRYHLYVSYACPWAHRTLIFRALKGLAPHVGLSVVHPDMLAEGWTFATGFPGTTGDGLHSLPFLRDLYSRASPQMSGRVTVPVLWDSARGTIVSNESAEIIRMFNTAFDGITGNRDDYWPEPLREGIEAVNALVFEGVNNGVYRAGFARSQAAYDRAVAEVFATLDQLEARLADRRWLMGDALTEADWRLFVTLVRFDSVYHLHFKCNRRRIIDYPNLWACTRALYQHPGVAETVRMDHIVRHYHYSHESLNPFRIIPINPVLDFSAPHGR
jgi:glutathionyl-hydroquinone reductase